MKICKKLSYSEKIKWRIRSLWVLLILMLVYMIAIGELNLGDSRMMDDTAERVSRYIFFGGMIYVICKIRSYKNMLSDKRILKERMIMESDEGKQYIHDKSGGTVWDIMLFIQLFLTMTAAFMNMTAFYFTLCSLFMMIILKVCFSLYYHYRQ